MVKRALLIACVLMAAGAGAASAQTDPAPQASTSPTQRLRLRDGSVLFGAVIVSDADHLLFRTISGAEFRVERSDIVSIEDARGEVVDGEFRPRDPNATRLLFAPTGRSLKRGDGYFGVFGLSMPFLQMGVTDRISIGGGTPLIFGFDEGSRPFWVTPKVQLVNRAKVQAAAGVMHIVAPEVGSLGIAYGVVTTGTPDAALTVGVGAGYRRYEGDNETAAIVMIGGERGLRSNIKFITENYVWNGGDGIVSAALRFYGDRLSADVGLFSPIGMDEWFVLPMINVVWTF